MKLIHALALALLVLSANALQEPKPTPPEKPTGKPAAVGLGRSSGIDGDPRVIAAEKPSYPLATCVVCESKLGDAPHDRVVGGHLVRLCGKGCIPAAVKDPAVLRKRVEAAAVREQKPTYPLTTCVATGDVLAFDSVDHVHGTRLVRLKNRDTVALFEKNSAEILAKLDRAWIAAQLPKYTATVCPVTKEALDDKAVNHLYGTRLVRLCCKGCIKGFEAAPEKHLAEVAKAK